MSARKEYHKAIRDRIPEILVKKGVRHSARTVPAEEFKGLLRTKLEEEVAEFQASGDPSELADILEVCFALAKRSGLSEADLFELRTKKREERGGFEGQLVLEWTE